MFWPLLGMTIGAFLIWIGFRKAKRKRLIQNIPTSKINTGAVGSFVEIKGKVPYQEDKLFTAPLSAVPCVLYGLTINIPSQGEDYDYIISKHPIVLVDEDRAQALVYMEDIELKLDRPGDLNSNRGIKLATNLRADQFSPSLKQAIKENKNSINTIKLGDAMEKGWHFTFHEWYLLPDEEIYVMGFADSGADVFKSNSENFNDIKMVFKKKQGHPYFLSNIKEKQLTGHYGVYANIQIISGVVIFILSSVLLIHLTDLFVKIGYLD